MQDIKPENILINYLTCYYATDLRDFLDSGRARFVLCDFGLSCKFPPGTLPEEQLRPSEESNWGTLAYHPPDGSNGEPFYNPFVFDVACLGGVFCDFFGVRAPFSF